MSLHHRLNIDSTIGDGKSKVETASGGIGMELTNNIGCMSKVQIEVFATMVLKECGYSYTMKWTTAGDIVIEPFIYIDERHIDE